MVLIFFFKIYNDPTEIHTKQTIKLIKSYREIIPDNQKKCSLKSFDNICSNNTPLY